MLSHCQHGLLSLTLSIHAILLPLLLTPLPTNGQKTFDVCQAIIDPSVNDYHAGVILSIATGNREALDNTRYPKCSAALNFDVSHNELTEVSFYKAPQDEVDDMNTKQCINWLAIIKGGSSAYGAIACNSTSPSTKIVETWEKLESLSIDVFKETLDIQPLLNFKIFIQTVDQTVEQVFIYTTSVLRFECTHPNPFLTPNVRKGGVDVDPQRLNGCMFELIYGPTDDIPTEAAGKYECSWEQPKDTPPRPTKTIDAVLYSPEVICEVFEVVDEEDQKAPETFKPVGHVTDNNEVHLTVFEGTYLDNYKMRCSLTFAGDEEQGKNVLLDWDVPVWDPAGTENGQPIFSHGTEQEPGLKKRDLMQDARLNSSIRYTCRISGDRVADFANGAAPKECKIRFDTKK